jgi:hypothetical protein
MKGSGLFAWWGLHLVLGGHPHLFPHTRHLGKVFQAVQEHHSLVYPPFIRIAPLVKVFNCAHTRQATGGHHQARSVLTPLNDKRKDTRLGTTREYGLLDTILAW